MGFSDFSKFPTGKNGNSGGGKLDILKMAHDAPKPLEKDRKANNPLK